MPRSATRRRPADCAMSRPGSCSSRWTVRQWNLSMWRWPTPERTGGCRPFCAASARQWMKLDRASSSTSRKGSRLVRRLPATMELAAAAAVAAAADTMAATKAASTRSPELWEAAWCPATRKSTVPYSGKSGRKYRKRVNQRRGGGAAALGHGGTLAAAGGAWRWCGGSGRAW